MATTRASGGQIQPNVKLEGNEGIVIPIGTTAQRNPNPVEGEIRFNTDLNTFEGYTGQVWGGMGPFPFVKSEYFEGDGSTYSFALEQQVSNPDDLTVLLNGVQLRPGIDFQLVGQRNIVFQEDDGTINPPTFGSTVSIRYFVPITSASVIANSISVEELAVVPGTSGQLLAIDQNLDLYFTSILPTNSVGTDQLIYTGSAGLDGQALLKDGNGFAFGEINSISQNSIGIRELKVSDGQIGQVLATDGQGNLTFISVSGGTGGSSVTNFFDLSGQIGQSQIPDNIINIAKLDVTDGTNGQFLATNGQGELFFTDAGVSSGEANDGINLGTGVGVFDSKSNTTLQFNSLAAGSGISVTENLNTITITNTAPNIVQNAFTTIQIAGETNITADSSSDTLNIVAGTGITLTTDPSTDTLTITGTSAGTTQNLFNTIIGDSGSTVADSATDSLTIAGGTDIVTSVSGDTVTITYNGNALTTSASIGDLSDVDITSTTPTNGQVLIWNNSNSVFEPGDSFSQSNFDTAFAVKSIDSLSDVDTSTTAPISGQVLKWNGSNWAPANDITSGGTGTDADTLDGFDSTYFLNYNNLSNTPTINSGTSGRLAYYSSNGTVISETSADLIWDNTTGNLSIGGILEADSLQSTGIGVPTFTSGSDIILNAANGAGQIDITGDLVVSGIISGDGSGLTNLPVNNFNFGISADDSTVVQINNGESFKIIGGNNITTSSDSEGNITIDSGTQNLFATISADTGSTTADIATDTLTVSGGVDISTTISGDTLTISYIGSAGASAASDLSDVNTSGATTGDMLYYNGSNWVPISGPVIEFIITANGSSDYIFNGPGFASGGENDPDLVLYRGHTYRFRNTTGGAHPFLIRTSDGGAQFTDGVSGSATGTVIFEVPMTPSQTTLVYQCQFHASMIGNITIV